MNKTITSKQTDKLIKTENTEEYFARIQHKYSTMSVSEKRIADFLLLNGHKNNLNYNITDLAKELKVSAATIVRFCRTLGFSGFSEFYYYMQRGLPSPIESNTKINANDSTHSMMQKISQLLIKTTNFVAEFVDKQNLAKAIEVLSNAKTILFCGCGTDGGLAQVAASIFQNTGMKSLYIPDELVQIRFAHTLDHSDVVIGITNCGYIKTVVDTLKIAQKRNVPTICITGTSGSLVTKYSDIVLSTSMDAFQDTIDQTPIIIAQMIIINALQIGYSVKNIEKVKPSRMDMLMVAELKRYKANLTKIDIERVKM